MHFTATRAIINVLSARRLKGAVYFYSSVSVVKTVRAERMTGHCEVGAGAIKARVDDIVKSSEDKRVYRGLVLSNRLKVLLVSDPTTDKAAAAMDVNVGSMSDPDEVPGLAHFCEHMLFLGTEKYPNENDYNKYLSEHGGNYNAATAPDYTKYYFDVQSEHFKGALDRFAQFFLKPMFTEEATDRELNAVNSEHEKNLPNDAWRLDQLDKHTCDPKHAYHKFGTGNFDTLKVAPAKKGLSVRDELFKFHGRWYSSNIMCLAILGKESLDELEVMAVEMFGGIEDKNVKAPTWEDPPFKTEQLATCTYMVPVKDIRNLNVAFPCPDLVDHYKACPSGYIANLVAHEGPGSILAAIKERGWSNSLVAGYKSPNRGTGLFAISLDLTEEGLQHTDEIVQMIFQYLNMLKGHGPLEWLHEELKHLAAITFRFKDKESPLSYIQSIARHLQEYPMEHVLSNQFILTEWEPEVIVKLLNDFNPDNVRVGVIAKHYESLAVDTEPWYGTKYATVKIPKETLNMWRNAGLCSDLKLPDKNEFIPENIDLLPIEKDITENPSIIKETAITRVWFKQDDKYLLPKSNMMFDFVSPLAYLDPLNCNLTRMFTQLFRDALNQYAYSAELAGLDYNLANTKYGILLTIGGYNDKQHIFLDKIMETFTNFKIDPKRFNIYKENYIRALKNFSAEQPYLHAGYHLGVLLTEHSWTKQELLAATEQLTVERLEAFIPQILSRMHIECIIHGNVNKPKALELVDIVEGKLNAALNMSPLLPRQLLLNRELRLEDGCEYVYEVRNDVHKSSCIEVYYQCGPQTSESNVILELIAKIIHEPCFNTLRTKEQLGYIVFSSVRRSSSGVQGLKITVQSHKHPNYVDGRIEAFLNEMPQYIKNLSDEEFLKYKEALATHRLEKPKQLGAQTIMYWSEIANQQYHFDRNDVEVPILRALTKDDVLKFFTELLVAEARQRHKIGVHIVSVVEGGAGTNGPEEPAKERKGIEDITAFKRAHGMHPLIHPHANVTRQCGNNKSKL